MNKTPNNVDFITAMNFIEKVKLDCEKQVPNFNSLSINKLINQLIELLNDLKGNDIQLLGKYKVFNLVYSTINKIRYTIEDPSASYLRYDDCINELSHVINICSLRFKYNKDNIKKRHLLTYYKGFTIKTHPFGRTTMGMKSNKHYKNEDEIQKHSEELYFDKMTQDLKHLHHWLY
jgi:hypothetical protein